MYMPGDCDIMERDVVHGEGALRKKMCASLTFEDASFNTLTRKHNVG